MRHRFDEVRRPFLASLVSATVRVRKLSERVGRYGKFGTGFFIYGGEGMIITAYHVVTNSRVVWVEPLKLSKRGWRIRTTGKYVADVVYRDKYADIAVLRVRKGYATGYVAHTGKDTTLPPVTHPLIRVGYDSSGSIIAEGHVMSHTKAPKSKLQHIDISMPSDSGGSGGPVFDANGILVGVMLWCGKDRHEAQWCSALPIGTVIQRLLRSKEIREHFPNGMG